MNTSERLTVLLRLVSFAGRDEMTTWIAETGLTHQQAFALGYIEANQAEGVKAKDIAEVSRTTPASVASLLQGLEERGLITRTPSPKDSRVKLIAPTPEGARIVEGFEENVRAAQERQFSALSDQEQEQLLHLLERLVPGQLAEYERDAANRRRER